MHDKRLIEAAFPLKQVSLDSVHEKNVRHGHISTLHIWPARRPLAACRAALIATLLSDTDDPVERKTILERMAGRVVESVDRKSLNGRVVEKTKEETEGGILHWGRENGSNLEWFRSEIRKAYGGRMPKVLDPFAGGGAIPLEAMRLGCDVTAMDINPVAWFILKCTLEYPQRLSGQTGQLPAFALKDREFMEAYLKSKELKGVHLKRFLKRFEQGDQTGLQIDALPRDDHLIEADFAWHTRAWGRWVLARARKRLASFYPTYAEWTRLDGEATDGPPPIVDEKLQEPLGNSNGPPERLLLLEPNADGMTDVGPLNADFDSMYLKYPGNPRWVAKPTVAYLWARTVTCKYCRTTLPLLKTRWLCKKVRKRVLLTMKVRTDLDGVVFSVQNDVPQVGGNVAQRREHDKRIGAGTMSRTGATCPSCGMITTMEDVRFEGRAGRLDAVMTAVVVDGPNGKEYRLPTEHERAVAEVSEERLQELYSEIPFGLPNDPLPSKEALGFRVPLYGFNTWRKLFTNRQLATQCALIQSITEAKSELEAIHDPGVAEAIIGFLTCIMNRQTAYGSGGCIWVNSNEHMGQQFSRFALPIVWDIAEVCPFTKATGGLESANEWVARVFDHLQGAVKNAPVPCVELQSAIEEQIGQYDLIVTDPPYYDAIPYSDLMDFFYVWLRRLMHSVSSGLEGAFRSELGPKWDAEAGNGELIDDASRFGGNRNLSKQNYEDGMAHAFEKCCDALRPQGRMVIVFASKSPAAWETLVAALIRAGFVVAGSWPIQTERQVRLRSVSSAALASSIWIVCKKRSAARPGWDNVVLGEMKSNISRQLHDFWDAGIRGPDFVWAATGPALEAFSKHPAIKKANDPDQLMSVSEFLREVRRMVVDFVVGRVLTHDGEDTISGLDDVTTYYLLHRHDFGMDEAPVGACILYALSCNLSDTALMNQHDLLTRTGRHGADEEAENEGAESDEPTSDADETVTGVVDTGGGAKVKLKPWHRRQGRNLGRESQGGSPAPLIDQIHRLMHTWRAGDQVKVNDYLSTQGLQRNILFNQILQALIELSEAGSDERSVLEALSNHVAAQGDVSPIRQKRFQFGDTP
ncbi:MAG: DUF1156 domain-containing protein [Gemmatimonadetes bacterium]|nr:DUF1156 domain-containing protein [Gemmatimonadota bacterium]